MTAERWRIQRWIGCVLWALAVCASCSEPTVEEPAPFELTAPSGEPSVDSGESLRETAPQGEWRLIKLTADSLGKDYGYWYLEDEDFKAGQNLLRVPSVDATFVVDDCTAALCSGHIEPGPAADKAESEGHLYPWDLQEHTFTWDGQEVTLTTEAEETNGVCYDTETGKDLPNTSWTDKATYKYLDVQHTAPADGPVESITAKFRVDYSTEFIPYCDGPTTMFVEGSIAYQQAAG